MFYGNGYNSSWGALPIPRIVKQKPIHEILVEATVRKVRVDGIKLTVKSRTGTFEQASYKVATCLLYECIMGMDTVSV